ncbi:hypothetical protein FRB96_006840 [Tulasnella sp. 330]|nr:hypothetical protein FRB96_006840 [Tulasnella sp. 330]
MPNKGLSSTSSEHAEQPAFVTFREWTRANGGYIHSSLRFVPVPSGTSVNAIDDIERDILVLSCPFSLAITADGSAHALLQILNARLNDSDLLTRLPPTWTERMLICSYVVAHWVTQDLKTLEKNPALGHMPYLNTLPSLARLSTSLTWNAAEMHCIQGTNLYHATNDRKKELESDHKQCQALFHKVDPELGDGYTFDRYLTAATYLSSRAFPSSLLSASPTLHQSPDSPAYPVLLPILDCLNHTRGQPVTWQVDKMEDTPPAYGHSSVQILSHTTSNTSVTPNISPVSSTDLKVSIKIRAPVSSGSEVCNNYGAKPNAELILGYGFALPDNMDDTIVLQLGGSANKWEIGRNGNTDREEAVDGLFTDALEIITQGSKPPQDSEEGLQEAWDAKLDAGHFLLEAVRMKLDGLPVMAPGDPNPEPSSVRGSVWEVIVRYVGGQRLCLLELIDSFTQKVDSITAEMVSLGMSIEYEDEDVYEDEE